MVNTNHFFHKLLLLISNANKAKTSSKIEYPPTWTPPSTQIAPYCQPAAMSIPEAPEIQISTCTAHQKLFKNQGAHIFLPNSWPDPLQFGHEGYRSQTWPSATSGEPICNGHKYAPITAGTQTSCLDPLHSAAFVPFQARQYAMNTTNMSLNTSGAVAPPPPPMKYADDLKGTNMPPITKPEHPYTPTPTLNPKEI